MGSVIRYDVEKGFGFIRVKERLIKEDVFIHFSQIEPQVDSFKKLLPDQLVEFSVVRGDKGLNALDLKIIKEDSYGNA